MFSRRFAVSLALGSTAALFAALVAVNSRLSWRPVSVDFAPGASVGLMHFQIAWRGGQLWMLSNLNGVSNNSLWKQVRNWDRKPIRVLQASHTDLGLAAICSQSDLIARVRNPILDGKIDLLARDSRLVRTVEERTQLQPDDETIPGPIDLLCLSPDGKRLVASSHLFNFDADKVDSRVFCRLGLVLFDVASGKQIARQSAVEGSFTDVAWSPDSRKMAGITADGFVFVLDGATGKLRFKFRAHQLFGAQVAWSPDGQTLLTASNPRLEFSPTHLEFSLRSGGDFSRSGGERPDTISTNQGKSKLVVTQTRAGDTTWNGKTERLLKRFNARTGKQIGSAIPIQTGAVDLAFSPDGTRLALGEHEFALLLNAQTLATERRLDVPKPSAPGSVPAPVCLAWSEDGATLATSTARGLTLWRVR